MSFLYQQASKVSTETDTKSYTTKLPVVYIKDSMIFKIIPNPKLKDSDGRFLATHVRWHSYLRYTVNGRAIAITRNCDAENDYVSRVYTKMKERVKEYKNNQDPNIQLYVKLLQDLVGFLQLKTSYYTLCITPNEPDIKVVELKKQPIDDIFGEGALLSQSVKRKCNIMNLGEPGQNSVTGWINIVRTGEGINTKYDVSVRSTNRDVQVDGMSTVISVPEALDIHPAIYAMTEENVPNTQDYIEKDRWSKEETEAFIKAIMPPSLEVFIATPNTQRPTGISLITKSINTLPEKYKNLFVKK